MVGALHNYLNIFKYRLYSVVCECMEGPLVSGELFDASICGGPWCVEY